MGRLRLDGVLAHVPIGFRVKFMTDRSNSRQALGLVLVALVALAACGDEADATAQGSDGVTLPEDAGTVCDVAGEKRCRGEALEVCVASGWVVQELCSDAGLTCSDGACVPPCVPDCAGKSCGSDSCGGICGTCGDKAYCDGVGQCIGICAPECDGKACGGDGCGGQCGLCANGQTCSSAGQCVGACVPDCNGKACGDDGCGGQCGLCADDAYCDGAGQCVGLCVPDCAGKVCGDDGCGGLCGACADGQTCDSGGHCGGPCVPDCDGRVCGGDGCGGTCGACALGVGCSSLGVCDVECPTALINVQEGEEVVPQTVLHLIGSQSYDAAGSIAKYEWSVVQPAGSQSVFLPSAAAPDPVFEANVAGQYVFTLRVWDENDQESCEPGEFMVTVTTDKAIHIELLWNTPGDVDQTDEGEGAGADLELHFLHPFATGLDVDGDGTPDGWFDHPFDAFRYNPDPDWGSAQPDIDDNPHLDRHDDDGAGPENINLNIPQDGQVYRIGVHYWDDHSFGPSEATVRVYIHGVLAFEQAGITLLHHDMWEVATVAWPSGIVTGVLGTDGGLKIIPDYEHPFFLSD